MPVAHGLKNQTEHDWRLDYLFRNRKLDASRAPDLNTMPRVFPGRVKLAQKVKYACESMVGSQHEPCFILFLRQCMNSFGNLHCSRQLVRHQCIAQLTKQLHKQEPGTIHQMTQGLGALVTNSGLGCSK